MNALLSSVLLALCAMAALASPVEERKEATNFSATCEGIVVNTSSLTVTATCQNAAGVFVTPSTIGLDSCIANINGELKPGNSFSLSCSGITAQGIELFASCRTPSGSTINTALDLNVVISNTNGVLTCP